jgi:hypothetical protein
MIPWLPFIICQRVCSTILITSALTKNQGQVKVIIAPHDAHALRASNDVPCDAYCRKLDGAFLDFYSVDECKQSLCVEVAVADFSRPGALQDAA